MAINHYFNLDGQTSKSYGVGLSGSGVYKSAERDITVEHIHGKSGDILLDSGAYFNRLVVYPCWMAHGFKDGFNAFRNFLSQHMGAYYVLSDTYNTDYFWKARVVGPIDPEVLVMRRAGVFDVTFDTKPQWFLRSGANITVLSSSGSITNPTAYNARPLLTVTGAGTVTIAGQEITIDSSIPQSPVTIDCDNMDAYAEVNGVLYNLNNYVVLPLKQIELYPGENTVTLSGVTQVEITPNWYEM